MKAVDDWLQSSIDITRKSKEPYRSNFEFELKARKELVNKDQLEPYKISAIQTPGTYKIMGQNPDDPESCYIGNVIIEFVEEKWLATWYISGATHFAYGMQVTDNILVFNFSYMDNEEGLHTGLVSYVFLSETIVHGEWIEEGFSEKGLEELRKVNETELESGDGYDANLGFSLN